MTVLDVPTLVPHGAADGVNHPDISTDKEQLTRGPDQRKLINGVGQFLQREVAMQVAAKLTRVCRADHRGSLIHICRNAHQSKARNQCAFEPASLPCAAHTAFT